MSSGKYFFRAPMSFGYYNICASHGAHVNISIPTSANLGTAKVPDAGRIYNWALEVHCLGRHMMRGGTTC